MTKQIERAYRSNRRRSWVLIAAVVALAAVIAIPIASGAPDKNYTLGYAVATQAAPSPPLTRTPLCTSTAGQTVTLYLTNTAKSVSLGSAEISLPAYATDATAFKKVTPTSTEAGVTVAYNTTTDKLLLTNLGLGKYGSVRIVVSVNPTVVDHPTPGTTISAIVKQSNDFNDTSGTANLFADPTFPTLTVQDCLGTISGLVWNDQNENRSREAAFEVLQNTWNIRLYKKVSGTYGTTPFMESPTSFAADGVYTFAAVPLGSDYLVCVAPTGSDAAKSWHQTTPTNNATCKSRNTANETNGIEIAPFAASVTDKNFGNAWSTVVSTCGGSATTNTEFSVAGGSGSNCKSTGPTESEFVYEKWTDGGVQYAAFHPVDGDGVCNLTQTATGTCTYFVQKMTWEFTSSDQPDPGNRSLNYDDKKNASGDYQYEAMEYCKKDPRNPSGGELDLAALGTPAQVASQVLPAGKVVGGVATGTRDIDGDVESSCLIKSTESTTTGGKILRVDLVFTAVDGRSAMG